MLRPCANLIHKHLINKKHQMLLIGNFPFFGEICLAIFLSKNAFFGSLGTALYKVNHSLLS